MGIDVHQPTRKRERQIRQFQPPRPTHVLLSVYGVVVNLFRFARHRLRAWHKSHCTAVSAMRRPAAALGALVVTCPVDNIVAFIGQDIDPAKDDRVGRRLIGGDIGQDILVTRLLSYTRERFFQLIGSDVIEIPARQFRVIIKCISTLAGEPCQEIVIEDYRIDLDFLLMRKRRVSLRFRLLRKSLPSATRMIILRL